MWTETDFRNFLKEKRGVKTFSVVIIKKEDPYEIKCLLLGGEDDEAEIGRISIGTDIYVKTEKGLRFENSVVTEAEMQDWDTNRRGLNLAETLGIVPTEEHTGNWKIANVDFAAMYPHTTMKHLTISFDISNEEENTQ